MPDSPPTVLNLNLLSGDDKIFCSIFENKTSDIYLA